MTESADLAPIREAVRALCADFPGEYWRELDRERAYPEKFVTALTEAGFLAALIPEEYGGSGLTMSAAVAIMEEIQASGCNGAACHAQMYTMGTVLRHGSKEQKARYLPDIARGKLLGADCVHDAVAHLLRVETGGGEAFSQHCLIIGAGLWAAHVVRAIAGASCDVGCDRAGTQHGDADIGAFQFVLQRLRQ